MHGKLCFILYIHKIDKLKQDDEYIEEREKLRAKKPKHLIDGME